MIVLNKIIKKYYDGDDQLVVIDNVSMAINKGDFISIMGSSGSGKTTLMNILGCLDKPTNGSYFINNKNTSTLSNDELALIRNKYIGFIFQSFHLLPKLNVLKNVELPLVYANYNESERKKKAKEALEKVGLTNFVKRLPSELSGGQKQRVAIARAIVNNPLLILADEPTGALDSQTAESIMEILSDLNRKGTTVILITHDDNISQYAKRVLRLVEGKIIDIGVAYNER